MRVETVEQYKILKYIKEHFVIEKLKLELSGTDEITITGEKGEQMIFTVMENEVVEKVLL